MLQLNRSAGLLCRDELLNELCLAPQEWSPLATLAGQSLTLFLKLVARGSNLKMLDACNVCIFTFQWLLESLRTEMAFLNPLWQMHAGQLSHASSMNQAALAIKHFWCQSSCSPRDWQITVRCCYELHPQKFDLQLKIQHADKCDLGKPLVFLKTPDIARLMLKSFALCRLLHAASCASASRRQAKHDSFHGSST